jgi:hypothetical protein
VSAAVRHIAYNIYPRRLLNIFRHENASWIHYTTRDGAIVSKERV